MKNYVSNYDYICFIHDKQSKYDTPFIHGESFAYKCYENVLSSKIFVENVIKTFSENSHLGLLVPPPPNHGAYYYLVGNEWMSNYVHTKELADALGLHVDIHPAKAPIAPLGSCFWFRSKALKPLFDNSFSYDDFPPEPVTQQDGTFMQSIERIYPFVAQSEGYYSGWLLSDVFANFEITNLYKQLRDCNQTLFWNFGIQDRHSLLHCVSTCKNSLTIMSRKIPLSEKTKLIIRKFLGTRGYNFLKRSRDKFYLWRGKNNESD
jgi:rhamnosyltransferase